VGTRLWAAPRARHIAGALGSSLLGRKEHRREASAIAGGFRIHLRSRREKSMSEIKQIADHFDRKAFSFDGIYSGEKPSLGRIYDRVTRKNIGDRFDYAFHALGDINGKSYLDVGCGSGRYCHEAARRGASPVVGLDVSPRMLSLAEDIAKKENLSKVCNFVSQDVLGFQPTTRFDVVTAIGFFDYVKEPVDVMSRIRELCASVLIASFPARWSFRVPLRKLYLSISNCPVYFYNESEIRKFADAAGFQIDRLERRGPIYMLVARPCAKP
jgi:2-polyprenyl-3-methyl-5-hydroxy-6-metoxy-1,4-benzoquinol methylase